MTISERRRLRDEDGINKSKAAGAELGVEMECKGAEFKFQILAFLLWTLDGPMAGHHRTCTCKFNLQDADQGCLPIASVTQLRCFSAWTSQAAML